ncbi:ATP-binding cassette domain-containing protein [Enorma massiliensis]|uniref:ATP-binding cassette domain-containing protein n=1 Tax=Enorma massiliensis TaxID=1472761 RepID=UPI0019584682|nr:ATP-binding cassette domain-containing protein [Enorma massiliensis]MBM6892754.1 ATP-binding cassette domain-containing protein [Enorma massiliensis]
MAQRERRPQPTHIHVRGARVHNLKNIDVDIPLGELVGIAGVSGSGKSSLALGTLYAEGSRRYLDALSTYTRRRISQSARATVDEVRHVPAALALRQRPGIPGVHSTFGTSTELLNYLRLVFSRLGSHRCPHCGAHAAPSMAVALMQPMTCPSCGREFFGPGAEDLAFNSAGACPTCGGTGIVRTVDEASLVPDESLSIDEGAVAPWNTLMWDLMKQVAREMGVRTDVPFCELTPQERDIVFHGPAEKKHILYHAKKGDNFAELDFTYFNAVYTVENALAKAKDEKGLARVAKFLREEVCPDCGGTRLSAAARGPVIDGMTLGDATRMTLDELAVWAPGVPALMPEELQPMAQAIVAEMTEPICRLQQLGLGYLSLDRASSTLSTGERQRVQLARAVRNRTNGVLYVLDEPSIGLHPSNVEGLLGVVDDLLDDGNSVVLVDHDVRVLRHADHLIEIGPGSGADGGSIIAQGTVEEVESSPATRIGPFLSGARSVRVRERAAANDMFAHGAVRLETGAIHTVRPLAVEIPRGRLTAVTGVSGSGKTTLVLESLIPGLRAAIAGEQLPAHVRAVEAEGLRRANLIDATPIGANVRSTVATYSGVLDDLRRAYAKLPEAKERGLKAGAFSYNTGSLRCPTCDGTGQISLDVQFLPDVDIPCPDCGGSRYSGAAAEVRLAGDISLPALLSYTVDQARDALAETGLRSAKAKLAVLSDLGLGYLTLGEATPALSGGEAQRLKLASELARSQEDALFVFDEPTIGLHPLDVEVLLGVLQRLIDNGATVVVIEHDLDMIANADWVIDMGPGGGAAGGRVVAAGTPEELAACPESITGRYVAEELHC